MKKLIESHEFQFAHEPPAGIVLDNQLAKWGNIPYAELSVVLVQLKFLAQLHQTHHWISKGDSYYGDHLLFERLYNDITDEIDSVAEKAVGLGSEQNVNMQLITMQMFKLIQCGASSTIPQPSELARRSLQAEKNFLITIDACSSSLKEKCHLSKGVDNMLAGIEDVHENHIYLLKQRTENAF